MQTVSMGFQELWTYIYIYIYMSTGQVYDILDAQSFLLPQRRNRVWGLAYTLTGRESHAKVKTDYQTSLNALRSTFQFPSSKLFQDLPSEKPKPSHEKIIEVAVSRSARGGVANLFIDCASSEDRLVHASDVLPCLTPSHKIWSTSMKRYLGKEDVLNSQGLWPSCFRTVAYDKLLSMDSQDLAGNSFASTVCQAVMMASFLAVPRSWNTIETGHMEHAPQGAKDSGVQEEGARQVLRRLKRKQPAPEFGPAKQNREAQPHWRPKAKYKRKVPGVDSRKNAKGKHASATVWQKEQVRLVVTFSPFLKVYI